MKDFFGNEKYRKVIIAFWVTFMVAIVTFVIIFIGFSKKLKSTADMGLLNVNTVNTVLPNNTTITKTASSSDDKDINEVANEVLNKIENSTSVNIQNVTAQKEVTEETSTTKSNNTTSKKEEVEEKTEEIKPLEFIAPVSGEIITDFADESLIYSNTLEEWTTHLGVDIKADKASAVIASESGTIKSIKNDPRYGLTITISHNDGYETVYSNLLSSEFVSEGDTVEKGRTIGTVGESASFEVAEVPHLHFEVYKNGEVVNPTTILK